MKEERSNADGIRIRSMRIEDYEVVIRIWDTAGLPYKPQGRDSREHIARELKQDSAFFLVAEHKGEIIGSVFGTSDGRKGWINRLAVVPEYQRQGIGSMLVEEVERRFYETGIEIIACLIENWNAVSLRAFQHMGYARHEDIFYFTKRKSSAV